MAKHGNIKFGPCPKREVPASATRKPAPKGVDPVAKERQDRLARQRLVVIEIEKRLALRQAHAAAWATYAAARGIS